MPETIQLSGLCLNCLNADECRYRMNHTKPIIFCEEFTCTDPSEPKSNIAKAIEKVDDSIEPMQKGICSNCENIETCNLQRTDDTVINCEEYR
ncbi:MAG: hypothetical protein K8S13_05995 [Desulfobacula sp.]|uniref:hypothetical protein n=1 Tax=Desulfobacula sp. TaxID=2593537 RepID=UPI0025C2D94D|nr:hypothetical protein [Desulfobacula sp.]MCD4719395.1 hypothetical protein [Desulfobacula sp.]